MKKIPFMKYRFLSIFLSIFASLFILMPIAFAGTGSTVPLEAPIGTTTGIDVSGGAIQNYTRILFSYVGGIVGALALLMIIVSGIQIMVSGGDLSQAKTRLIGAIAGLIILAAGGYILYLINPCYFGFQASTACTRR